MLLYRIRTRLRQLHTNTTRHQDNALCRPAVRCRVFGTSQTCDQWSKIEILPSCKVVSDTGILISSQSSILSSAPVRYCLPPLVIPTTVRSILHLLDDTPSNVSSFNPFPGTIQISFVNQIQVSLHQHSCIVGIHAVRLHYYRQAILAVSLDS